MRRARPRGYETNARQTHRHTRRAASPRGGAGRSERRCGDALGGLRPAPPPAPGRPGAASRAAGSERGGGGGAKGGEREGGRARGTEGGRGGGAELSRAERAGHGRPPPGCPGPLAAPPPATHAVPGGPRSARGRGSRSRSRRREQRAGAPGARMQGERRRPSPGAAGQGTPGGRTLGGEGLSVVGRSRGLSDGRGLRLRLRTPPPNLGTFGVTSPGSAPSSEPGSAAPGGLLSGGGDGRSGGPGPTPAQRNSGGVRDRSPVSVRLAADARTRPRGWAELGAPLGQDRAPGRAEDRRTEEQGPRGWRAGVAEMWRLLAESSALGGGRAGPCGTDG